MFAKYQLSWEDDDAFELLSGGVQFENIAKGRQGAILVHPENKRDVVTVPLVRSTSTYQLPVQQFQPIHYQMMDLFLTINPEFVFNNTMIEMYDDNYRTMKPHSDQALDLRTDSFIAILSCYDNPDTIDGLRRLKVEHKVSGQQTEIVLNHLSLVVFSLSDNAEHLHKIVLDKQHSGVRWLGLTFRRSKTFIEFRRGVPYFAGTDKLLTLCTDEEKQMYFKCRKQENTEIGYTYPLITFTISSSDLLPPSLIH